MRPKMMNPTAKPGKLAFVTVPKNGVIHVPKLKQETEKAARNASGAEKKHGSGDMRCNDGVGSDAGSKIIHGRELEDTPSGERWKIPRRGQPQNIARAGSDRSVRVHEDSVGVHASGEKTHSVGVQGGGSRHGPQGSAGWERIDHAEEEGPGECLGLDEALYARSQAPREGGAEAPPTPTPPHGGPASWGGISSQNRLQMPSRASPPPQVCVLGARAT